MAAETEGVGNGDVDVSFYGFIGYIIEAQFFQFVFRFDEVDRRMDLASFDGHGTGNGFDSAGSAESKERALREAGAYIAENTQHILDICLKLKEEGKL